MTREQESELRAVFRKHITTACDEIANAELTDGLWWPEGYAERLAEMCTQSIALATEACVTAADEAEV